MPSRRMDLFPGLKDFEEFDMKCKIISIDVESFSILYDYNIKLETLLSKHAHAMYLIKNRIKLKDIEMS